MPSPAVIAEGVLVSATVLGALIGLFGIFLTIAHKRRAKMRKAADKFAQEIAKAANHVGNVRRMLSESGKPLAKGRPRPPNDKVDEAFAQLEQTHTTAVAMLASINQQFGEKTVTWPSAVGAEDAIHGSIGSLRSLRDSDPQAINLLDWYGGKLEAEVDAFGAATRADIRWGGLPLAGWLRGQRRRLRGMHPRQRFARWRNARRHRPPR